jgi:hypothetical protein
LSERIRLQYVLTLRAGKKIFRGLYQYLGGVIAKAARRSVLTPEARVECRVTSDEIRSV